MSILDWSAANCSGVSVSVEAELPDDPVELLDPVEPLVADLVVEADAGAALLVDLVVEADPDVEGFEELVVPVEPEAVVDPAVVDGLLEVVDSDWRRSARVVSALYRVFWSTETWVSVALAALSASIHAALDELSASVVMGAAVVSVVPPVSMVVVVVAPVSVVLVVLVGAVVVVVAPVSVVLLVGPVVVVVAPGSVVLLVGAVVGVVAVVEEPGLVVAPDEGVVQSFSTLARSAAVVCMSMSAVCWSSTTAF